MLWGSLPAKIDEKFRLKVPAKFRRELAEIEGNTFIVTSDNGLFAQIFPISVWQRMQEKLRQLPRMDPARLKFERITSLYGSETQMDSQGRILIPQLLREDAQISGDVIVIGGNDHIEVWNTEIVRKSIHDDPLTNLDRERLAHQGV